MPCHEVCLLHPPVLVPKLSEPALLEVELMRVFVQIMVQIDRQIMRLIWVLVRHDE